MAKPKTEILHKNPTKVKHSSMDITEDLNIVQVKFLVTLNQSTKIIGRHENTSNIQSA